MVAVSEVLDLCDGVLAEPGRRQHVFSWLTGPDGWLAVDAYYPASRLVVVCPPAGDGAYRELVPSKGLRLLELSLDDLPAERQSAEAALRRLIADAGPARPPRREAPQPSVREPRPVKEPVQVPQRTAQFGAVVGALLFVLVLIEAYIGVLVVGLDGGHMLLGFALALDGCARALGAIAAGRTGRPDWALACVVGGSPFVAAFALFAPGGPVKVDPAPLAGLISLLAGGGVIVSLIAMALGA